MSGSQFLNHVAKLEHENDLLRDAYEEVKGHLEAMKAMRDELRAEVIRLIKENPEMTG